MIFIYLIYIDRYKTIINQHKLSIINVNVYIVKKYSNKAICINHHISLWGEIDNNNKSIMELRKHKRWGNGNIC